MYGIYDPGAFKIQECGDKAKVVYFNVFLVGKKHWKIPSFK